MSDEVVDTTEAPAEGAEPTEPTEEATEVVVEETEVVEEAPAPVYVTAEDFQAALDKQTASTQSWLGRRDKETLNHIGNMMDQRFAQQQEQASPEDISASLLDDPRKIIRSEMDRYETERSTQSTMHINTAMETVGNMMEADPLYTDKDLGNEVVAEIKTLVQTGKVNTNVPASESGKLVLADALTNVMRTRQNLRKNPLKANSPSNKSAGLKPPATPPAPVVKAPKLDDVTQKMADKWGYSPEDLASIYGE